MTMRFPVRGWVSFPTQRPSDERWKMLPSPRRRRPRFELPFPELLSDLAIRFLLFVPIGLRLSESNPPFIPRLSNSWDPPVFASGLVQCPAI